MSKSQGKRSFKTQGSSKTNSHCTASMIVTSHKEDTTVNVLLHKTHYGHSPSLGHLSISESDKLEIAGKLTQGITFQRILDDVRDNLGERFERIHLLTRKDITNIERSFGLRTTQRHSDDATSVRLLVEEMGDKDGTPGSVLFYKPQGEQPQACEYLELNDFALGIQTALQAEMMKQLLPDKVVCMDSTHGTNSYSFSLVTVMGVDEYGEGYPLAWCLSNREDQLLLVNFFNALKDRVGNMNPKWFMTDDAEQFYSAWVRVFGGNPNKLLCAWHVDRAWRENLKQISNRETQVQVYHNLRLLLEETDKEAFETLLSKTTAQLSAYSETKSFAKYFTTYYAFRKQQWASCYRHEACVNTNMYMEAFHRVLKYIYLKGKVNKRVDHCVHTLLKIARDKGYERLVKLEKGKQSLRFKMIKDRHKSSIKLSVNQVKSQDQSTWLVTSDTKDEVVYTVTLENDNCPYNCYLKCSDCGICIHTFTCNCIDSLIRSTICKHIHLVARLHKPPVQDIGSAPTVDNIDYQEETILNKLMKDNRETSLIKERVKSKLNELLGQISKCDNQDLLIAVEQHVNTAQQILKAKVQNNHSHFPPSKVEPPNKKITQQRPFFSTRRKRTHKTAWLGKPTQTQKNNISEALLEGWLCQSCQVLSTAMNMIACDFCNRWYHW